MNQLKNRLNCLMIGCVLFPGIAWSDAGREHAGLAQLIHELDGLQSIIDQAQTNSNQDARIRFHYDGLRIDLNRIRLGIYDHLVQPRQQPRSVPPLKGDYRQ